MSSTKEQQIIAEYVGMGFDVNLITHAWRECKGNEGAMLDTLLKLKYFLNTMTF